MKYTLDQFHHIFFIGVAGAGMSALAQYLAGSGKQVSGSDRYFVPGLENETRDKLEAAGIRCFEQNGSGISPETDLVVVSTAVESTVPEVQIAMQQSIPILKRSELLAIIAESRKTVAIGGTSGKSTTTAMLFHILTVAGKDPSIISGAGLTSLIRQGLIGNAHVGKGDWLLIEADESDGSIVQYHPEIGVLLNIDKDHQELEELNHIFSQFRDHCKDRFIVNRTHPLAANLSKNIVHDFSADEAIDAGYKSAGFEQAGDEIRFTVNGHAFLLHTVGRHNMENALAAAAVAHQLGVPLEISSKALSGYEGIYRRHQVLGNANGLIVIDDYAHNPVKCASSIQACQPLAPKLVAWFQPHGYGPTRFLKDDFIHEFAKALRPQDEIWMSEIYYAGGTATKDISSADLVSGIRDLGRQAFFVADRQEWIQAVKPHIEPPCVLLLMGARDPGLESFGQEVWKSLSGA